MREDEMQHSDQTAIIARLIASLTAERVAWLERKQAAEHLVELGEPVVLPLLQILAQGAAGWGTELLIATLGRLGDARAVEPLIQVLKETNPHDRQAAAKALTLIGDPRAIDPLINSFRIESGDTEDITAWQDSAEALARFGALAFGPLVAALLDENGNVRVWSADALGQLGDLRAVVPLIVMLSDPDPWVRIDAIEALGKLRDPEAIDPIAARLTDPAEDDGVRMMAASTLGHLIDGQVFAPLVRALDDSNSAVRCNALLALAESAGPASLDLLLPRTTDPDPCVRHKAVLALGRVGDENVLPLLESIEQQDEGRCRAAWVKEAARYAIERIRARHLIQPT